MAAPAWRTATMAAHRLTARVNIPAPGAGLPNPFTVSFLPDPYVIVDATGAQLYEFAKARFTINVTNITQYSLNWVVTSLGWEATAAIGVPGPDIKVLMENTQGGVLDIWDVGPQDQPCSNNSTPVAYINPNGKAGILNNPCLIVTILLPQSVWRSCYPRKI
jgi:hypothetical protein